MAPLIAPAVELTFNELHIRKMKCSVMFRYIAVDRAFVVAINNIAPFSWWILKADNSQPGWTREKIIMHERKGSNECFPRDYIHSIHRDEDQM